MTGRCETCGKPCNKQYRECVTCDPRDETRKRPLVYPFGVGGKGS